jgi:hypothetical protein
MSLLDLPSTLLFGLFTRGLGLIYLIAIASLYHQVLGIAGSRGITPIAPLLARIREDFPGWRRFAYFPTVLWINSSDRALRGLVILGIVASIAVIVGGSLTFVGLLVCFVVYLSLDLAMQLWYPWDCVLLEAGFLALFLPGLQLFPSLEVQSAPLPIVSFAFRFLVFRVMFGFGTTKFVGSTRKDLTYLQGWAINQPIPTRFSFLLHRSPLFLLKASIVIMFLAELVIPFMIFFTGLPRLVAAVVTIGLMVGIQFVGNYGFFNLVVIVCSIPLFDLDASLFDSVPGGYWGSPASAAASVAVAILVFGGLIHLPFDSWCTRSWMFWTYFTRIRSRVVNGLIAFYRLLAPFRLVHPYGVFPRESGPAVHWIPVFEGSRDGAVWKEYGYRYMPCRETSQPRMVAPYHPRLDHWTIYEGYGVWNDSFTSALFNIGNPYAFTPFTQSKRLMQRLLEGEPSVTRLFNDVPFPSDAPPRVMRMRMYALVPRTPEDRRSSGKWWRRIPVGTHMPETRLNKDAWAFWPPAPELFHWDELVWKRRCPELQRLKQHGKAGDDAAMDRFFQSFLPEALREGRNWEQLDSTVKRLTTKFSTSELHVFERTLARLAIVVAARLEPVFFDDLHSKTKKIGVPHYFRLGMLAHFIIGEGRAAVQNVLNNPQSAAPYFERMNAETGSFLFGVFRMESFEFHARKFRLLELITSMDLDEPLTTDFFELRPLFTSNFKFDDEALPAISRLIETGEWRADFSRHTFPA